MALTIETDDHCYKLIVHEDKTAFAVMAIDAHAHGLE